MSRLALALGLVLVAAEAAGALWLRATSDHEVPPWPATLTWTVAGSAFVVAGLVALWRRPSNRTGLYVAATGYLWFLGGLTAADNAWVFTIGGIVGDVALISFAALVLAYPSGQLHTRIARAVPLLVAVAVVARPLASSLVDPTPSVFSCDDCPESALLVSDQPALATAIDVVGLALDLSIMALVVGIMARRWGRASPALRRSLKPVLATVAAAIVALFVVNVAGAFSDAAFDALVPVFYALFALVPLAFLFGILRARLARSSVTDLMVALREGVPLREALADALGDPTLEIAYRLAGSDRWVNGEGATVPEPVERPGRAQTTIEHSGLPIAVLDYDAHLADERELIDGVAAAAGLLLQNERLYAGVRAQYSFLETITDTAPSLLVNVGLDGRILNQNQAAVAVAGVEDQELVRGRYFWDVFIDPSERADVVARFRSLAPEFPSAEYENTFTNDRGEERVVYWRTAPVRAQDGTVMSIIAGGLDITDRQRLAEEKEREREFLNAIANNAPSLLCLIDERGVVAPFATNVAFERTLEYTPEETGGEVFWEHYVAPEDADEVRELVQRVLAGETVGEHDHHWVTSSGERLLVAWTCTALPRLDERTLLLVTGVDVTERKVRELELQRERDVQTTVFESMPSIMVVLAPDGTIRDRDADDPRVGANSAFLASIRWPDEEIVGRPFRDLLVEDDDGRAARAIEAAAAGATSEQVESEIRSADGSARTFTWSAIPIADVTGRMEQLVLVCGADVTERKARERELRRERDFLSATANSIPTLLVLVDADGVVAPQGANAAFRRVLGFDDRDVDGRPFWEVVAPPDEQPGLRAAFLRSIEQPAAESIDSRWYTRDGDVRLVEWTTVSRPGAEGGHQYLISANDVTLRHRQEEEIRASRARIVRAQDEARRALERNLHDGAQQRLVALSVNLRLVEAKLRASPDEASALLQAARDELAHALEELRELARGIHPAVLTDRGLGPALEALASRVPIPVEVEAPKERLAPAVEAAAYYVVAESLTNVVKYGKASSVGVCVTTVNGTLSVTVADDGVGGADPERGSGLRGLADRVEALEGKLRVESPPGHGTRISAEIPMHPVRPTPG